MSYPYSNEELFDMFRKSSEANFVRFLQKLDEKMEKQAEEEDEEK